MYFIIDIFFYFILFNYLYFLFKNALIDGVVPLDAHQLVVVAVDEVHGREEERAEDEGDAVLEGPDAAHPVLVDDDPREDGAQARHWDLGEYINC